MNAAIQVTFDLSKDRMRDQLDTLRLVTTKASIMIGIAAIVVTAEMPVLKGWLSVTLFWAVYASLTVCAVSGLVAIVPRTYWDGPKLKKVGEILASYEIDVAKEWIANAQVMACEHNVTMLDRSTNALFVGIVTLVVAFSARAALYIVTHFA